MVAFIKDVEVLEEPTLTTENITYIPYVTYRELKAKMSKDLKLFMKNFFLCINFSKLNFLNSNILVEKHYMLKASQNFIDTKPQIAIFVLTYFPRLL